jgi:aarF domain-containing kinase
MLPGSPFWISILESYSKIEIPKVENDDDSSSSKLLACSSSTHQERSITRRIVEWLQRWWQRGWKAFLVATRTTEVFLRLSPLLILMPAAYLSEDLSEMAWNYALQAVQGLGPVAVKFCQWMATRRDIFPSWCCDRFGILHDQGTPHSWAHTDQLLSEAFGDDYNQKGLQLQPNDVIGCGSAAQVYRGTLTTADQQTRTVAIKVLHPDFKLLVERDLQWMQIVAEFLHSLPSETLRMLNLPHAAENFGYILKLQADLTNEAENLQQFRSNFYHSSTKLEEQSSITFPRPIDGWNNTKVLVEEYVHNAIPISDFLLDSTPEGLDIRRELAGPLLRAFLKMVFLDNFVHGDLHPGNVLVQESKQKDGMVKRSIVFLDAGIANSLSPTDQRNLRDLFRAVIFNDGHRAGRLMVERAKYERCSQVPGGVEAFANGVADIVSEFHDRRREGLTLGAVRIGSLLSRVLDLCRIHGVEIDPAMASVVISTLVLEGLGRSLSAELNLIDFAKPFLLGRGRV